MPLATSARYCVGEGPLISSAAPTMAEASVAFTHSATGALNIFCRRKQLPFRARPVPRVCPSSLSVSGRFARALAERIKMGLGLKAVPGSKLEQSPPAGLLLEEFVGGVSRTVSVDVPGDDRNLVGDALPNGGQESISVSVELEAGNENLLQRRLGEAVSSIPGEITGAVEHIAAVADDRASAISSAVRLALHAIGLGPDSEDAEDDSLEIPSEPAFDPVTALVLAGYAFQAYLGPARGSYWESYSAIVHGSEVSGMVLQTVNTRVAYPSTDIISDVATGAYMIRIELPSSGSGAKTLDKERYIVAVLNGTALHEDSLQNAPLSFSLLRKSRSDVDNTAESLVINVYNSRGSYSQGDAVLATASISLQDVLTKSKGTPGGAEGRMDRIVFNSATQAQVKKDFFEFNILPEGLLLPFGSRKLSDEERERLALELNGVELHVQVSYIPFDMPSGRKMEDLEMAELENDLQETVADAGRPVFDEEDAIEVSKQMSMAELPLDWAKLARELHVVLQSLRESHPATTYLREDIPRCLFIESLDTNSQVWLYRDVKNKQVVISFRGTEQVEWQDFFTDALAFLQAWRPGDQIILDIKSGLTMGLDIWDGLFKSSKDSSDEYDVCGMPCVHWGFLRAYLSVRDSLDRSLSAVTNDFEPGYVLNVAEHRFEEHHWALKHFQSVDSLSECIDSELIRLSIP